MTHNLAYSKIFRFRNLAWLAFLAAAPVLCAARAPFPQKNAPAAVFARTQTGVDVLEAEKFAPLRGLRVGVITNQTGVDSQGRRTIDLLAHTPGVKLVAIFSPEHGIAGLADADVSNGTDAPTGLPIYSLYGATRRPTDAMLEHLDALVFDIQDAGVRFYTFTTTMAYCMEAAAQHHIAFFVLDRPDPLGGQVIEGPMLDPGRTSFVGYFPMPVRYAMTLGELAEMFNAENKIGAALHVIPMKNWRREETYSQTG
ncbi:MAG: exo-beta-N-acetylmuramidase NamZ family protein, partial [Candidatus Acidiferrales bacterium]